MKLAPGFMLNVLPTGTASSETITCARCDKVLLDSDATKFINIIICGKVREVHARCGIQKNFRGYQYLRWDHAINFVLYSFCLHSAHRTYSFVLMFCLHFCTFILCRSLIESFSPKARFWIFRTHTQKLNFSHSLAGAKCHEASV